MKEVSEDFENQTERENPLPWNAPEVNDRVMKSFNLRLREPDFLKLKFIASQTRDKSMHSFCVRVLMDEVRKELGESKE